MSDLTKHQKAALNHRRHISLTANAGSGKTFVLAKRFLTILIEEKVELSSIVAITFTDKAARELYKRIANEIEVRINEVDDKNTLFELERLRKKLISARISTIHSFCTEILKEFPTEAKIDASFLPIDQRTSSELIANSIDEVIQNSIRKNDELIDCIKSNIRLLGSKQILQSVLIKMIAQRDDVQKIEQTIYSSNDSEVTIFFRTRFQDYFNQIFSEKVKSFSLLIAEINSQVKSIKPDNEIVSNVEQLLGKLKNTNDIFQIISIVNNLFQETFTSNGTLKARGYFDNNRREGFHNAIELVENIYNEFKMIEFADDYSLAEKQLALFGLDILTLWNAVLSRYTDKKKEKGYLDFEDLLLHSEKLVQREDVKIYLSERYKYFMVDEYQDTNETQYNIFIPILDYLKRGNLFIVGDEKQSIYMFRGADLRIFEKTKSDIQESNGENSLLQLPHSFRLSKELTLFTNTIFGKLFSNPNLLFNEVAYNNLVYARNQDVNSEVAFLISDGSDSCDSEFKLVAKKIKELVDSKNIEYRDIAILSRRRKSFSELEKELQDYNIPYQIYGGKGFYQRQEIYDVYSYLNFLLNPKSGDALIAILRSPFFMVSDRILYQISKNNGDSFYEKLENFSKSDASILKIYLQLKGNIQDAKSKQISVLIRDLLQNSGYWAKVASQKNSEQIFANLDKLVSTSISFMDKGSATLYDFAMYLRDAIDKTEDESQAIISEDDTNIKLMTIHGAKGLEFPVVFLVDTNNKSLDDRVKAKSVSLDKDFGILTKTAKYNYLESNVTAPIVGIYNYLTFRKSSAELKRLLYVAVTRAENYLFISGTLKAEKTPTKGSFLSLLQDGLSIAEFSNTKTIEQDIASITKGENGFIDSSIQVKLEIPFINSLDEVFEIRNNNSTKIKPSIISAQVINDIEQNEIISASKISVYNQCPLKYNLVYDIGFTSLFYKEKEDELFTELDKEESDNSNSLPANIHGSIIHRLLEEEISIEKLDKRVEELVLANYINKNSIAVETDRTKIIDLVSKYLTSDKFKEINSFQDYYNEYEIYIHQNDFYLYGIIDKLILDNTVAYVIDYKTDSLKKYSAQEKLESYKYQLMFYAYLVSKMNPKIEKIICQLVFIEAPNENVNLEITKDKLVKFGNEILANIKSMREGKYGKNLSHCKSCYFSDEKYSCIIN